MDTDGRNLAARNALSGGNTGSNPVGDANKNNSLQTSKIDCPTNLPQRRRWTVPDPKSKGAGFRGAEAGSRALSRCEGRGCGLNRSISTFASPFGGDRPRGGVCGIILAAFSGSSGRRGSGQR